MHSNLEQMRKLLVFFTLCICFNFLKAQHQEFTFTAPDGNEMTLRQYYVVFLKSGNIRSQSEAEVLEIQNKHIAYLTNLWEQGIILLNGPFDEDAVLRGMSIYATDTEEKAREFAENDPAVQSGRLKIEIHPWWSAPFIHEFHK